MRNKKIILFCILSLIMACVFTGCSGSSTVSGGHTKNPVPTERYVARAPTATPTAKPTATPIPTPRIISVLYEYLNANQDKEAYTMSGEPTLVYSSEHTLKLVYDEAPTANGTAYIVVNTDSNDVNAYFAESNVFGAKVCAPPLIKSVVQDIVSAICQDAGVETVAEKVLLSYEDGKYTYITYAGDYAFVFAPSDTYKADFYAVYMPDYRKQYRTGDYKPATYDMFCAQMNAASKFAITATVKDISFSSYRNSYKRYPCMIMKVEDASGNLYKIAHHMYKVPLSFAEGEQYTFYGTTMFDINNEPLLYLHYAE